MLPAIAAGGTGSLGVSGKVALILRNRVLKKQRDKLNALLKEIEAAKEVEAEAKRLIAEQAQEELKELDKLPCFHM